MKLSESREKALSDAKRQLSTMGGNLLFQTWRREAIESFNFYDGIGQYSAKVLQKLGIRKQEAIVINKVRSMINQASGMEINTRGNIAYAPQSNRPEAEQLTKAMTHFAFAVQKKQHYSFKGSLRCRDMLTCGLGWSRTTYQNNQIFYDYINPLNVIYDADDFSPQLENMRGLIYMHWMSPDDVKSTWPKYEKLIDNICKNDFDGSGNFTSEYFNRTSSYVPLNNTGSNGTTLQVNECFRKEKCDYYEGIDKTGYYFQTFSEEFAEKIANKKSDIEEKTGTRIMRTVFCNDILLEYGPLSPNLPNQQDFPLVPAVWLRRTCDGVPIGWLEDLKDPQRLINFTKLKHNMSLNSVRARIDVNAIQGMSADEIRDQLQDPSGILFTTGDGPVEVIPNIDISEAMVKASERLDYELQQVSGMYSDSMGDTTNAQSGVAIKRRQIASSKNLAFGFDTFTYVKEREGKLLLDLMQGCGLENVLVNITLDNDEKETFVMNLVRESDGQILNDIRTIPADVYVEIVPDYDSFAEERQAILKELLQNPIAPTLLQNKPLLKEFIGARHVDKIAEAAQQIQQQQNEQDLAMKGISSGMPPPNIDAINPTQLGAVGV
jgi:hypothetical protein